MSSPTTQASIRDTRLEIRIEGAPAKVWKSLTAEIGAWWPAEFYVGGEPGKRSYHLDATPGGRMYESWEHGGGLLWGNVVTVDPEKLLQVTGSTFPEWGGPSQWFGSWTLEADGSATILTFSESTIGKLSDAAAAGTTKAWHFLFGEVLKSHVEGRPIPAWEG